MRTILGIDIGAQGALALLDENGSLLEVADMPILRDGPKNRPSVNGALLAPIVRRWQPSHAFVEFVDARPGEGAVGAFAFGRSRGAPEGALGACGVPATTIAPASWTRALGSPAPARTLLARKPYVAGPPMPNYSPA